MADVPAAPTPSPAPEAPSTFDQKLAAKLGIVESEPSAPTEQPQAEQATEEVADGELSTEDIQTEDEPSTGDDYLELDHPSGKRKVSKEEAKRLAQQGHDYSQKMEKLNADRESVESFKQALQLKQQVTPEIVKAEATVMMYGQALQQYANTNWMQLAQTDPIAYTTERAKFDQLREGMNQAMFARNQVTDAVTKIESHISQAELAAQFSKVFETAPELRDPKRYASEVGRIKESLTAYGISSQEMDGLTDHRFFAIARDAARYRQALQAKAQRDKGESPSLRPGPAAPRANAETRKQELTKALHQAKTPERKKAAFDALLAAKMEKFAR